MGIRERIFDRTRRTRARDIEFSGPNGAIIGVALRPLLEALFARLAPGRPLSRGQIEGRTYNWGADEVYVTADGDGLLIAEDCFGAVPGDGVDSVFHLLVGDDIDVVVKLGHDYRQDTFTFRLAATPEAIDVATDALLQVASATGLVLVRRDR